MNWLIMRILRELRYLVNSKGFKKLITAVLLISAVCMLSDYICNKTYAATTISDSTYYDGVQATYKDYEALQNDFVVRVLNYYMNNNHVLSPTLAYYLRLISNGGYALLFYYGDALGTYYQNTYPSPSQKNIIELIVMDASQVSSNTNNFDWGLNGVQGVRGYVCASTYNELKFNRGTMSAQTLAANTARHYLPSYLVDYKSSGLLNLIELYTTGGLNGDTANALITAIENQTSVIEEQGQQVTNSINSMENTIKDDTVENLTVTDLPTDSTTDITESGFSNIFDIIYNGLVRDDTAEHSLIVDLPIGNSKIVISIYRLFGGRDKYLAFKNGALGVLITQFWNFVLGLYIYKDIYKYINKLKSGNIDNIENDNVKESML